MNNELKFDVRLLERNLAKGIVTEAEYQEFLKNLPDAAPNAENLEQSLAERLQKTLPSKKEGRDVR